MNKELIIEILKESGYTTEAARKSADLGAVVMDNLEDFNRELPGITPEEVLYKGKTYYIAEAL